MKLSLFNYFTKEAGLLNNKEIKILKTNKTKKLIVFFQNEKIKIVVPELR